jgi:hypothetical protein
MDMKRKTATRTPPRQIERAVLVEAGHRCAIPTCRQTPVEIAHIIPWARVKEHTFDNLIVLCPTCHTRYDSGEIDRKSMQQYKANLSVLNSRYGDLERRVLKFFAEDPNLESIWINKGFGILLMYLVEDGLLEKEEGVKYYYGEGNPYHLTDKGREFIKRWLNAEELE